MERNLSGCFFIEWFLHHGKQDQGNKNMRQKKDRTKVADKNELNSQTHWPSSQTGHPSSWMFILHGSVPFPLPSVGSACGPRWRSHAGPPLPAIRAAPETGDAEMKKKHAKKPGEDRNTHTFLLPVLPLNNAAGLLMVGSQFCCSSMGFYGFDSSGEGRKDVIVCFCLCCTQRPIEIPELSWQSHGLGVSRDCL